MIGRGSSALGSKNSGSSGPGGRPNFSVNRRNCSWMPFASSGLSGMLLYPGRSGGFFDLFRFFLPMSPSSFRAALSARRDRRLLLLLLQELADAFHEALGVIEVVENH